MAKKIIKKNDEVLVIAGSHKGSKGTIISISKDRQKVKIDKVNIVKKHVKPTQQNPDGGIQEFEAPIHISNVKLVAKGKEAKAEKKLEKKEAKVVTTKTAPKESEIKPAAKKEETKTQEVKVSPKPKTEEVKKPTPVKKQEVETTKKEEK